MRNSSLDDDEKVSVSSDSNISEAELLCIRNIELLTDANIKLEQIDES
jgi:hypothetical protein